MSQVRKRRVVVAASHADSMAGSVECNERCNDEVEFSGRNALTGNRLPEPECAPDEARFALDGDERQLPASARHRSIDRLTCTPRAIEDHARIDFIAHRDVAGDRAAVEKFRGSKKAPLYLQ